MRLALVVLLVTIRAARADMIDMPRPEEPAAPAIALGALGDPQVRVASLRAAFDGETVQLAFVIATGGTGHRETTLPIDLPAGTRVRTLAVTIGKTTVRAEAMRAQLAREAFERVLAGVRDPALLEQAAPPDRDREHLRIRVFPVERGSPVTVAIGLELPALRALVIDPGGNAIERAEIAVGGRTLAWRGFDRPRALELPEAPVRPWDALPRPSSVDAAMSLFAGPATSPVPTIVFGGRPIYQVTIDKQAIRRVIKSHRDQLAECYEHDLQFGHPTLAGSALLQFLIGPDGRVHSVHVSDDLGDPAVTSCLEREVAAWEFYASAESVQINYPLTFTGAK